MVFGDESGEKCSRRALYTYNVMEARRLLCAFYRAAFTMTAFAACKLTSAFGAKRNVRAECSSFVPSSRGCTTLNSRCLLNATAVTIVKLPNYANRRGLSFQGTMYRSKPIRL